MAGTKDHGIGYESHFPGSRKVYARGSRDDIRVPLRELTLSPSRPHGGGTVENPRLHLYDTSGPWTDPDLRLDVRQGLPSVRGAWVDQRDDVEFYAGRDGHHERDGRPVPFPGLQRERRRARAGANVTQMHYARQGIVTPEMEYVALRENLGRTQAFEADFARRNGHAGALAHAQVGRSNVPNHEHPGAPLGARIPRHITPEFVRQEVAEGRAACLAGGPGSP
jgi:phosphomethylpyrimidine synthase